jgi:hypothetical protein
MVVILVIFQTVTRAEAAAAVAAMRRKLPPQNLTETRRENAGPFLNGQIQILS